MRLACASLAALALACSGFGHALAQNTVPEQVLQLVAPAIVRVVADGCSGETRSGTGFVWQTSATVVTDLHVIIGCSSYRVFYGNEPTVTFRDASIDHVLQSADLVMLSVQDPVAVAPLKVADAAPPAGAYVDVYGYPLDEPTSSDAPLYVPDANTRSPTLTDVLDDGGRAQIKSLGFPDLSTQVLRVVGYLLPGHSGAPIIDRDGGVVAIGSGGLERGTVGLGWAVRASYLAELASAGPSINLPSGSTDVADNFASVSPSVAASIQCGDITLVRTRTMPLEALRANADDPVGLDQIAATSTEPLQAFDPLQFDIWTVESSGAGVAVPSGATLTQQGKDCVADWGDSAVTLLISGYALDAPSLSPAWQSEVQSASVQFEQDWAVNFYPFIAENPQFSYLFGPRFPRPGMVVNRKLFQGRNPNNPIPYGIFETLMAKGDSFVGVAAIDRRFVPVAMLSQDQLNSVASAVFAVQLSTFPAQLK